MTMFTEMHFISASKFLQRNKLYKFHEVSFAVSELHLTTIDNSKKFWWNYKFTELF